MTTDCRRAGREGDREGDGPRLLHDRQRSDRLRCRGQGPHQTPTRGGRLRTRRLIISRGVSVGGSTRYVSGLTRVILPDDRLWFYGCQLEPPIIGI